MSFFRDLRNFFKFNTSERRAVSLLLLLIVLSLSLTAILSEVKDPKEIKAQKALLQERLQEYQSFLDSLKTAEAPKSFRIDTAQRSDWLQLGLQNYQVDILENYSERIGGLSKQDLYAVYTLDSSWLNEQSQFIIDRPLADKAHKILKDTISQRESQSPSSVSQNLTYSVSFDKELIIEENFELNGAETLQLEERSGVGPKRASIIINYKKALGGYHSLDQIDELYAIPQEVKDNIKKRVSVDPSSVRRLSLSNDEFKAFLKHPYLDYFTTKLILNASDRKGFKIEDLQALPELSDSLYKKIRPYLTD